ncbi:dual specificity protein phosphatase 12 isoform X2 [Nelusetta ayraudi]|uniref:dual specificity protein phosphatase 12 isoform X2 n=1 Tax=Nelusetta ayraudi TaxID=303726 RepID=UPI003F70B73A
MLLVDSGLYIGTAADLNDSRALRSAAVTHVLSVDSEDPAAKLLPADGDLRQKWINVLDEATSDLLSHLDDCFLFIREAVEGGSAALVHCQAGRSRSATVVTAYLMKTHKLGFTEAYQRLRDLKADVQVNSGFEEQLRLYESLQCGVDTSSPLYKQYRLQKLAEKYPGGTCSVTPVSSATRWEEELQPSLTRSPATSVETCGAPPTSSSRCSGWRRLCWESWMDSSCVPSVALSWARSTGAVISVHAAAG